MSAVPPRPVPDHSCNSSTNIPDIVTVALAACASSNGTVIDQRQSHPSIHSKSSATQRCRQSSYRKSIQSSSRTRSLISSTSSSALDGSDVRAAVAHAAIDRLMWKTRDQWTRLLSSPLSRLREMQTTMSYVPQTCPWYGRLTRYLGQRDVEECQLGLEWQGRA
jgi:hypothetical protein